MKLLYSYQKEKLFLARSTLMLPHREGESRSIGDAFFQCSLAFRSMDESKLDESAREYVKKLKEYMERIHDTFTIDEKSDISNSVDELANWFCRYEYRD